MDIQRQPEESLLDYRVRICTNKEILNLTWDEVAEILNKEEGNNHGESVYRKWFHQFRDGMEYANERKASSDDVLDELTLRRMEVEKERKKLQSEKLELNKWLREQARTENIYEKIERAIEALPPLEIPDTINIQPEEEQLEMTVDIADAHYGREGKILGLNGETIAEYSPEIFEKRMWELLRKTVVIANKENIKNVHVLNLGDSIDGMLRPSQLQTLVMGSTDQAMQFAEFISKWLNELSRHVHVEYYSTLGNHSETRPMNAKGGDFREENLERIIPWFVKERLRDNPQVVIHDPKVFQVIDVLGTKIAMTHGQDDKNLENSIKDYSMIYGGQIHLLKTGHLHHEKGKTIGMNGIRNIEYSQSPSICGVDEYSMKLKKTANAGSLINVFKDGYGKYITYDIRLT